MLRNFLFIAVLAALAPSSARAAPQLLANVRGGVSAPGASSAGPVTTGGGFAGEFEVAFARQYTVSFTSETSVHWVVPEAARPLQALRLLSLFQLRYRLDVGRVIPYGGLGLGTAWLFTGPFEDFVGVGALGLGAYLPVSEHLQTQLELRYGLGMDGRYPSSISLMFGAGWRSSAF